jgi:hypothetical protein
MAKRLYMTTADYVTIALSPALVMTLVGSLVYFLIEVLYVGEYQARLMYVFALFVFSAVLIARIAIENGSEYASLFALPLGLATFFVLLKFVEHPSPFSWLINIALMCVVWWCADRLTWDCTLIDDDEDSSGEGLMQRMGADEGVTGEVAKGGNELVADSASAEPWWRRFVKPKKAKHTPGLWVLYFSLAALPLFGVGQYWVPPSDVGRRQYVFSLLLVYVASALALLVTTSFLGLRRYLRQRRVEMPGPMAANWIGIGAVLIMIVMLLAALIPRPHAEYAISQVPWQVTSPGGQSSSRFGQGSDGSEDADAAGKAIQEDAPQGDVPQGDVVQENGTGEQAESDEGQPSGEKGGDAKQNGDAEQNGETGEQQSEDELEPSSQPSGEQKPNEGGEEGNQGSSGEDQKPEDENAEAGRATNTPLPEHAAEEKPFELPKIAPPPLGGLAGLLKLVFYVVVAILAAVYFWRNRQALAQAVRDILRQLRELLARLFGGRPAAAESPDVAAATATVRHRTFAEFRDPFATGDSGRLAPEELVRYTFEAFEAWARDAGHPRSPDQTPAELVRVSVPPQTPLFDEARNMTRLYSQIAYASGRVSPAAAESLRELWSLMQGQSPRSLSL